jgi:hypothetical protein
MLPATTSFHFALVFSLIVCPASAFGQDSFSDVFINLNAESFVRFSGTGLGTGAAEEISTTYPPDLMDPFLTS